MLQVKLKGKKHVRLISKKEEKKSEKAFFFFLYYYYIYILQNCE